MVDAGASSGYRNPALAFRFCYDTRGAGGGRMLFVIVSNAYPVPLVAVRVTGQRVKIVLF